MANIGKPGGATPLGRVVSAVLIAAVLVALGYWWTTRPKAERQPEVPAATQTETPPPAKVEVPTPRAETPQASPPAVAQPTPRQQQTGGSDDPYGNLSIKEKK